MHGELGPSLARDDAGNCLDAEEDAPCLLPTERSEVVFERRVAQKDTSPARTEG